MTRSIRLEELVFYGRVHGVIADVEVFSELCWKEVKFEAVFFSDLQEPLRVVRRRLVEQQDGSLRDACCNAVKPHFSTEGTGTRKSLEENNVVRFVLGDLQIGVI